jgi:putative GTP pyrophosphokinase
VTAPARSRVDRAGKRLRDHQRAMAPLSDAELTAELAVVEAFRAAHIKPLTLVAGDLRRHVADASQGEPRVGERLKRMDTILNKLERQATMALSRMHDIAGCRAIVSDQAIADALIDRLRAQRDWEVMTKVWDYVAEPKADGYRAKHLVAVVEGFRVEVQVRTRVQQEWADLVEDLDRQYGLRIKFGEVDPVLVAALRDASDAMEAHSPGALDAAATLEKLALVHRLAARVR